MDPIAQLLSSFGINIVSTTIYDLIKARLLSGPATHADIEATLRTHFPQLTLKNISVIAETAIDLLAQTGNIRVTGSKLYARTSIWMRSAPGTQFTFGDGSESTTDKSQIIAGQGAQIVGSGGAEVRQNPDGSIDFRV